MLVLVCFNWYKYWGRKWSHYRICLDIVPILHDCSHRCYSDGQDRTSPFSSMHRLLIPVPLDRFLLVVVHSTLATFECTQPMTAYLLVKLLVTEFCYFSSSLSINGTLVGKVIDHILKLITFARMTGWWKQRNTFQTKIKASKAIVLSSLVYRNDTDRHHIQLRDKFYQHLLVPRFTPDGRA